MTFQSDFTRTAAALREYDAFSVSYDARVLAARTHEQLDAIEEEHDRLARAVGVAFGLDTSRAIGGPNDPEVCADLIRPGPSVPAVGMELSFVRKTVRRWQSRVDTVSLGPETGTEVQGSSSQAEKPKEDA